MILFGLLYKKYHRSIMNMIEVSWNCHRSIIKPSQNRHKASCIISKPPTCEKCPKNRPILWALDAYYMGNECPLLVLSMPDTWSLSAHLMVSYRPLNGLLQTTLCAFIPNSGCQSFLLFLVCIDILYILKK